MADTPSGKQEILESAVRQQSKENWFFPFAFSLWIFFLDTKADEPSEDVESPEYKARKLKRDR